MNYKHYCSLLIKEFPLPLLCLKIFLSMPACVVGFSTVVKAAPCYPTDPTGSNPQNPCLIYPPPGIAADSFVTGVGSPIRELPTISHPSGKVIVSPNGYWSGSDTRNGQRTVRTNSGQSFSFPAD